MSHRHQQPQQPAQQQHYSPAAHRRQAHLGQQQDEDDDDDDDDEEDDEENFRGHDGIRRSFHHHHHHHHHQRRHQESQASSAPPADWQPGRPRPDARPATIQVTLDEGYFARERRLLVGAAANLRARLAAMQPFNPAKNDETIRQQQQWTDKEKYTLDSLNELKAGNLDERSPWTQPDDGREVWPSKLQYFLAIISYSIGLGNVIRFPILVQKNGGLAFVLPFLVMLVLEGIPLLYLELAIGQRMRKAAIAGWSLVSPIAAGIGLASAAVSFVIGLYYNTMVSWTLVYLWASLGSAWSSAPELPYAQCPAATVGAQASTSTNRPLAGPLNNGTALDGDECQAAGPYEFYWYRRTLDVSPDVDQWAPVNWRVGLCLAAAWLISYLCLVRGLSSSKRLVYVASTFPYVILVALFLKATRLRGWQTGVHYLFAPQWAKLLDPFVWLQAAAQVFFSLGLGFGGLIALSSYNPINNNCYRDSIKVALVNFGTSLFAGVVIFALLGSKAHLGHERCLAAREHQIDYYLADYNLKVLDNGAIFKQVPRGGGGEGGGPGGSGQQQQQQMFVAQQQQQQRNGSGQPDVTLPPTGANPEQEQGDYDSEDAIASINNLDRQLDLAAAPAAAAAADGDADVEFLINASALIGPEDLARIIDNIPQLPSCSIASELERATQGQGLVFVVLAEALGQLEAGERATWSALFFLMILALGFDSQFGNLEGLLSALLDLPLVQASLSRQSLTGLICGLSLALSLGFFAHGAGPYMFAIFDEYAGSFSLVLIALFELLAISQVYGLKRFAEDCELMTGRRPPFLVLLSWRLLSPGLLLVVTLATLGQFSSELNYEVWWPLGGAGDQLAAGAHFVARPWPPWCVLLGACLVLVCVLWIPGLALLRSVCGRSLLAEQPAGWFPVEDLRELHGLDEASSAGPRRPTRLERILFGFTDEDYY